MKRSVLGIVTAAAFAVSLAASGVRAQSAAAGYDFKDMPDMSDFDPATWTSPTGDTSKVAIVASFSGPAALVGQVYWASAAWAAHDINKRGGIVVDGKKKLIELIKADHASKPDQAKRVVERMVLQEKVNFLWGTDGSNLQKIINETANKYKVIAVNTASLSDDLQDATNFSRYAFQTSMSADQLGRGLAWYYGQMRRKESYPQAQIVGEDYHKLFLTDYAPYLEKVKASGAEVVFTGDWIPDAANLLKQARQMGVKLPFAHVFMDEPNFLTEVGVEGTKGLVQISQYGTVGDAFKTPEQIRYYKAWNDLWQTKWKTAPFNTPLFQHPAGNIGSYIEQTEWLFSVIARAKSVDPEKIIKVWENDSYRFSNGKVLKMRACDHKAIQELHVFEFVPPGEQKQSFNIRPYYWNANYSAAGPIFAVPSKAVLPLMDTNLDRCKGANPAGE